MNEFRAIAARDDSFAQELLPQILIGTVGLALTFLLLVLVLGMNYVLSGIFPIALLAIAHGASAARQRSQPRLAGWILSSAFGFLPALTVPLYGLNGNPLVYLALLGVMIAALTVSARAAVWLACGIFALLLAEVLLGGASIMLSASALGTMLVLLVGITALSAAAKTSIHDTIG